MNWRANRLIGRLIDLALDEDLFTGDVTTEYVVPSGQKGCAHVIAKESFRVAGLPLTELVFARIDPQVTVDQRCIDGSDVVAGEVLIKLTGRLASLLAGERTILNFIARLSGVATLTAQYVESCSDFPATIIDTRKTTPGWRVLEKYAVRIGGARNHRLSLSSGILIKDNHIKAANGVTNAVQRARRAPHNLRIQVEVKTLAELDEALNENVDAVLLDNLSSDVLRTALTRIQGKCLVEVSGGITIPRIQRMAGLGVDLISVGALTHQARSVDLSMNVTEVDDYPPNSPATLD